ncbi:Transcriptional regulator WAR1 [Erysiphe necator]|nr:Transcriptional regulator WAR1 [Erysiphe necator]
MMSNPEASIDPLLRNIAPTPSLSSYHLVSPTIPSSSVSFSRSHSYERNSPYLNSQNLQRADGPDVEISQKDNDFNNSKRSRACEACRGLKVRCEPDPNTQDDTCKRCAKANRICIVTAPSRKRRKKTDSRVAELEKKIDALTASLAAQRSGNIAITQRNDIEDVNESQPIPNQLRNNSYVQSISENYSSSFKSCFDNNSGDWSCYTKAEFEPKTSTTISSKPSIDQNVKHAEMYLNQPKLPASTSAHSKVQTEPVRNWLDSTTRPTQVDEYVDLIDRGLLTSEIATNMFNDFVQDLIPIMPIVAFPPGTNSASIRKSAPILFLAILSAGSSVNYIHLQQSLTDELMKALSERIFVTKYKSIELIQALQISSLWYWPVESFDEIKFYQLRHTAAIMAIDIGIGRKNRSPKSRVTSKSGDHPLCRNPCLDPESVESRRTWLSCYLLCCSASLVLRRPNIIHWSSFTADCVEVLENSEEAFPSDRMLCQWVKIFHISEEIGTRFFMDDPGAIVSFADSQVQHTLRGFERDLEKWRASQKPENMSPNLKITEHGINLYMHEVATQVGHQIDNLKPPFTEDTITAFVEESDQAPLSSARVTALSTCLVSIDGIFETFLDLDVESILLFPAIDYAWIAYATGVLLKLYFAAATPNSELGKIINKESMKVEYYFDRLIEKLRAISGEEVYRCSTMFLHIMIMMRDWFHRQINRHRKPSHQRVTSGNQMGERSKEKIAHTTPSKNHSNFSSGNTMLQLLSEVATGNNVGQTTSNVTNNYSTSPNKWRQSSQSTYPGYPAGHFPVNQAYAQPNMNGNIDPSLKIDLEYSNVNGPQNAIFGFGDLGPFISDDAFFGGLMNSIFPPNMGFEGL